MRYARALQDLETSIFRKYVNDRGTEKTRKTTVKLRAGTVYALDDEAYDRLIALGYIEQSADIGESLV